MKTAWILCCALLLFGSAAMSHAEHYDLDALSISYPRWFGFIFLASPAAYIVTALFLRPLSERTRFCLALLIGIAMSTIVPIYSYTLSNKIAVSRKLTHSERIDLAKLIDGRFVETYSWMRFTRMILVAPNSDYTHARRFLADRRVSTEIKTLTNQ